MTQFLYIASSSFSGSTLLSFLLNTHPEIVTVGEMDGWNYAPDEVFPCSCGAPLSECVFFRRIAAAFQGAGLPFDPREFGTRYTLVRNTRLNRYLTATLPHLGSTRVELVRDRLVGAFPPFARLLARQDLANRVFIQTAVAARQSTVFVDACKIPFRLRHLRRIPDLNIHVLHLVRDPRGVALSNMKKKGYRASLAIRLWLNEQVAICRVAKEFPRLITVYYEDLCGAVEDTLAAIYKFMGVAPRCLPRDFRSIEHHILGNEMRLAAASAIVQDARWMRELSATDLGAIARACAAFRQRHANHLVSEVIARYGCDRLEASRAGEPEQAVPQSGCMSSPPPERTKARV